MQSWSQSAGLLLLLLSAMATTAEDAIYWRRDAEQRLKKTLGLKQITRHAKNVVLFVGDGMGISTITAARIYKGQRGGARGEESTLSWEAFPTVGLSKTYNVDRQVPDSAGTATAMFCGVKSNYEMLGLDSRAKHSKCEPTTNRQAELTSLVAWAQWAGKLTGIVTTTRVTHATPAAMYAHTNNRDWECDSVIPPEQRACAKDIARQLVEDSPGRTLRVVLGGGQKALGVVTEMDDDSDACVRTDKRNLAREWATNKTNARVVYSKDELMAPGVDQADHLFGVFSPNHIPYRLLRGPETPSLLNMTQQALRVLSRGDHGFLLLVEGGRIDHGHHENQARLALDEAAELDETVAMVAAVTSELDTLIVVTADHSHTLTINGYPRRGNDILGFNNATADEPQYETLTYANGPSYFLHRKNESTGPNDTWRDLNSVDRNDPKYGHFSPVYLESETHGGEDVAVYARGPYAHLLSGVFEQNYIAHAVGYSACIGPAARLCDADATGAGAGGPSTSLGVLTIVLTATTLFLAGG